MADASNIQLDLDALAPKGAVINIKDKHIEVQPLELDTYSELLDLSSELSQLKTDEQDPKVVMPIYRKLKDAIDKIIPELADEKLNLAQIIAVFNLLVTANSPEDKTIEELKARGIELKKEGEGDPKASTSSEQSASSSEPTQPTE